MADIKPENQRRVIHVEDLDTRVYASLYESMRIFSKQRPDGKIACVLSNSATYLFGSLEDTAFFGNLLDAREIPFSYHPAKDYNRMATQNMA